jgi:potassium-transporting ATPase KdpC subunit
MIMTILLTAFRFSVFMLLFCGLVYPLAITGLGQAFFPKQANGSLIYQKNNRMLGSTLIGQGFTQAQYFHPRPAANSYDASNSGGANLGASSQKLITRIQADTKTYQTETGEMQNIPIDAVTTSASSLDPHISLDNALKQVARVAKARGMSVATLRQQVMNVAEKPFLSEAPYINVLTLNLAIDQKR